MVKNPPANVADSRDSGSIPGLRRSSGGRNGNHSSILALIISWTAEPDRLQSMELQSQIQLSSHTFPTSIKMHKIKSVGLKYLKYKK